MFWSLPFIAVLVLLGACYVAVTVNAWSRTYVNAEDVPEREYALLLGTSPVTARTAVSRGGAHNFYFENRIRCTAELYNLGKVHKIIASGGDYRGDPGNPFGCDEPAAMRDSLVKLGVKPEDIILDYKGLRTINSIINTKEMGIDSVVIISQKYHNERAIWQADHFGLHAVGYNAPHSPIVRNRIKNVAREFPARVKLMIDMARTPKMN